MNWHNLNWIDYVIIVIIALSSLISLIRGFIREALSLATWIIAFWIALTFTSSFSNVLTPYISEGSFRSAAAFFILFAVTLILGAFVNYLITQLVEKTGLSGTDRLLGIIFGFGRGVLLVALILLAAQMTSLPQDNTWQQAQLVPSFQPIETWLSQYLPNNISGDVTKSKLAKKVIEATEANKQTQSPQQSLADPKMLQQSENS